MKNAYQTIKYPDRISSYFAKEKGNLILVTITGILYNVGLAYIPWFEGQLAQGLSDKLSGNKTFESLALLAIVFVLVNIFVQIARYLKRYYVRVFANNVNRNMKLILYNNLVHKTKPDLENASAGDLMTKTIADVDACAEGMRKFTTEIFDTGIALVSYAVLLFIYDYRLAFIALLASPASYLLATGLKKTVVTRNQEYKVSAGKLNELSLDRVSGALSYRVTGSELRRNENYEGALNDYEHKAIRANMIVSIMQPLYEVIAMISVIFIIWLGSKNVLGTGWTVWNIAAFTAFLSAYAKLATKASKSAKLFNSVQQAQVSWKRIKPLLKPVIKDEEIKTEQPKELKVANVSFNYPDGPKILEDLSFSLDKGMMVGITGPIACGKSTLGKLFLNEYPYEGKILYGNEDLSKDDYKAISSIFAYEGHDCELVSDSIEDNILLGKKDDADKYLALVDFDREVKEMPEREETLVGNNGNRLSGGQQSRLALARTLAHPRPVLILDDPFAAVDVECEKKVFKQLREWQGDRIIILLSHRLTLFPKMDKVIWLEDGKITMGDHQEIMDQVPEYAHLYGIQKAGTSHAQQ